MLCKITVVLKEHGKVGDLLACYVGGFLGGVRVWFFFPFFLSRLTCLVRCGFKYFKVVCFQNGTRRSFRIFHVSSVKKPEYSRLLYYRQQSVPDGCCAEKAWKCQELRGQPSEG